SDRVGLLRLGAEDRERVVHHLYLALVGELLDHAAVACLERAAHRALEVFIYVDDRLGDARLDHGDAVVRVHGHRCVWPRVFGTGLDGDLPLVQAEDTDGGRRRDQHDTARDGYHADPPPPPRPARPLRAHALPRGVPGCLARRQARSSLLGWQGWLGKVVLG